MLQSLLGRWRATRSRSRALRELRALPDNVLRDLGTSRHTLVDYLDAPISGDEAQNIKAPYSAEIVAFPKSRCLSQDPDCCEAA